MNCHLQRAWNKYGEQAFEFDLLLECASEDVVDSEQFVLDAQMLYGPVFNMARECVTSRLGVSQSYEARRRVSAARKGKPLSPDHRRRIALGVTAAHKRSPEAWAQCYEGNRRPCSQETRGKISVAKTKQRKMVPA